MDWQTLFLKLEGRIGKKDFWVGVGILIIASMILSGVPVIGQIWGLASVYFGMAVLGKRLHDIDRTAWLAAIPFLLMIFGPVLAFMMGGATIFASGLAGLDGAAGLGLLAGLGVGVLVLFAGVAVFLGMVVWLGITDGTPETNQFGPPRDVPLVTAI